MLALVIEAVDSDQVAGLSGWCLSGLLACNGDAEFAATCIRRESTSLNRQHILDAAIRDFELAGVGRDSWLILHAIAKEFSLEYGRISSFIEVDEAPVEPYASPADTEMIHFNRTPQQLVDWDTMFSSIDLLTSAGIARAEVAFRKRKLSFEISVFWNEVVNRVPSGRETEFLELIPMADSVDLYDVGYLMRPLRLHWMGKASVKAYWPQFLRSIGKRYSAALAEERRLEYLERGETFTESELVRIKEGILLGLAESLDLVDAQTFFGYIAIVAPDLNSEESVKLLDYALTRFELHIDVNFGDGPWADWLIPPSATIDALTGLIWSALGSPISATRWQAVHCVRRLLEAGCNAEIDSLFGWLERDVVGAFGSHRFPFYRLHSRLYLLMGLARTAYDVPERLYKHASAIKSIALTGVPHILIQKTAADIALLIERALPGTYSDKTIQMLERVGMSPFRISLGNCEFGIEDSAWLSFGGVKNGVNMHFAFGFENYWFKDLSNIFGVSDQNVLNLGCEAAVSYLGVTEIDGRQADPRRHLWNSRDYEWGTSHSQGGYPLIDDYWFYYSYHSFLSVAARLLRAKPLVHRDDDCYEDRWKDWLQRHSLTRTDGRWLFDRRDPSPLKRRGWIASPRHENWRWSVTSDDFLEVILHHSPHPRWLCLAGDWTETDGDRIERLRVSSAFVTPETSDSLANALRWCESPWDFRLPYYGDEGDGENVKCFQVPPFELTGWIRKEETSDKRLDGFDPHARRLGYPPYEIGARFAAILDVKPDYERREWRLFPYEKPQFISELWSEYNQDERDKPYREGARICGAVTELSRLCGLLGKDLVFSVEIDRLSRRYRGSPTYDAMLVPPSHKIFILSSDGKLKDKRESHQIG